MATWGDVVGADGGGRMTTRMTRGWALRMWCAAMALMVALALAPEAAAQGNEIDYMEPNWQASYWANTNMSGYPAFIRTEGTLNHNWGTGSPDWRVPADYFSARWSRYFDLGAGTYRFTVTADDGVRLWVDGHLLVDAWRDQPPTTYAADIAMSAGEHMVMVEYYERAGGATISVSWAPVGQPTPGPQPISAWRGEYYNNTWVGGTPVLVRDDAAINFGWDTGSPAPGIVSADRFSTRWTRGLSLTPGRYRFSMTVDDGGMLWVNGVKIIDAWADGAPRTLTGDAWITSGVATVRMEHYENTGLAVAKLSWQLIGDAPSPSEIVVDDGGSGFVKGGSATGWRSAWGGQGGSMTWTLNNDWRRPNYNWARWYPSLQSRWYEVLAHVPASNATTQKAQYWVSHYYGYSLVVVDQRANAGRWVSLGTYRFRGTSQDYLSLNDTTYEPYLSAQVAFDAAKWVPR
jgi:hypothetical protein